MRVGDNAKPKVQASRASNHTPLIQKSQRDSLDGRRSSKHNYNHSSSEIRKRMAIHRLKMGL